MITITGLIKTYGTNRILDIPNAGFEAGKVHVLAGPNGSGKTTLLRIISGLEPPTSGSVNTGAVPRERVMVFQKPYMFRTTVTRNITYGLKVRRWEHSDAVMAPVMKRLGLDHLAGRNARTLSGGEMQKVAIARALILEPRLLLLDEPFANLDEAGRKAVQHEIHSLNRRGATILVTTHITEHMYRLSGSVTRLDHGRALPPEPLNILEGIVCPEGDDQVFIIKDGFRFFVVTDMTGEARAVLAPEDVILSSAPFPSSMRNTLAAAVAAIAPCEHVIQVTLDAGIPLIAHITSASLESMALKPGMKVYASFKATAVKVY